MLWSQHNDPNDEIDGTYENKFWHVAKLAFLTKAPTQYVATFSLATEKLPVKAYIVWIVANHTSFFVLRDMCNNVGGIYLSIYFWWFSRDVIIAINYDMGHIIVQ